MRPVVSPKVMQEIEQEAFAKGVSDETLMEEAAYQIAHFVDRFVVENRLKRSCLLLCGKGNNGGDTFLAGTLLMAKGYLVEAIQIGERFSPLCQKQRGAFLKHGGKILNNSQAFESIDAFGIILDGLFGTGFKGEVTGPYLKWIERVNRAKPPVVAVDIPSGLDGESGQVQGACIQAVATCALTFPKTGFYLNKGWNAVGSVQVFSIGLSEETPPSYPFDLLEKKDLPELLPPMVRNRHKFMRGHVVLLAGSVGMTGSAYLASLGAFRGGAGYVHLLVKEGMETFFPTLPELITLPLATLSLEEVVDRINGANACVVGPGLGRGDNEMAFLASLLPQLAVPLVLDADALWFLAHEEVELFHQTLLTPHHGEMARLLDLDHTPSFSLAFLSVCKQFAEINQTSILLKGAPTFFLSKDPQEKPLLVPFGDPGMATAGSGDLLSGVIGALLAQGLETKEAALLGASLHGLAGMQAAAELTSYAVKASDIAEKIADAFTEVLNS